MAVTGLVLVLVHSAGAVRARERLLASPLITMR